MRGARWPATVPGCEEIQAALRSSLGIVGMHLPGVVIVEMKAPSEAGRLLALNREIAAGQRAYDPFGVGTADSAAQAAFDITP